MDKQSERRARFLTKMQAFDAKKLGYMPPIRDGYSKGGSTDSDNPLSEGFGNLIEPKQQEEGFFERWAHNPMSQALFNAGMTMMASPSSNPLQAIGQGGMYGARALQDAMADEDARKAEARNQRQLEEAGKLLFPSTEPNKPTGVVKDALALTAPEDTDTRLLAGRKLAMNDAPQPTDLERRIAAANAAYQRAAQIGAMYANNPKITRMATMAMQARRNEAVAAREELARRQAAEKEQRVLDNNTPAHRAQVKQADVASEALQKRFDADQEAALAADEKIGRYSHLRDTIKSGELPTGPTTELLLPLKKFAAEYGLADRDTTAAQARFAQESKKLMTDAVNGKLGAGISNADMKLIEGQVAGVGELPETNVAYFDTAIRLEQRKKEIAELERAYRDQHGYLDAGFNDALAKWANAHPLFPSNAPQAAPNPIDVLVKKYPHLTREQLRQMYEGGK